MKRSLSLLIIVVLFVCGIAPEKNTVIKNSNAFAINLFQQLVHEQENSNLLLSPYSISQALGMTYEGAKNDTRKQMQNVLGFPENNEAIGSLFSKVNDRLICNTDTVKLSISNGLWAQKDYVFLPKYFESVSKYYNAPLEYANFKTRGGRKGISKAINAWVKTSTNGNIEKLIKPSDLVSNTRLVLVNAIWFNAHWKKAFKKEDTRSAEFSNLDESKSSVQMMTRKGKFEYYEDEDNQTIKIPYKGDKLAMIIILPRREKSFLEFEKSLEGDYLDNIQKKMLTNSVQLSVPKFKAKSDLKLKPVLRKMGMSLAFSDTADFSGMTGDTDLKIDKVIHKSFIDVSEEGTEAAATTAVTMVRKTAIIREVPFNANHPFVYLITDINTGIILFVGRYVKGE